LESDEVKVLLKKALKKRDGAIVALFGAIIYCYQFV